VASRRCRNPKCPNTISDKDNGNKLYCEKRCSDAVRRARAYAKEKERTQVESIADDLNTDLGVIQAVTEMDPKVQPPWMRATMRRGPAYEKLLERPELVGGLLDGSLDQRTVGQLLGFTPATISRILEAIREDIHVQTLAFDWELEPENLQMLGLHQGEAPEDEELLDAWLDEMTSWFGKFRETCMTDERGDPYITKQFHLNWIKAILWAIFTGSRQMILSPPRHGKTQLLIDFCIWLILRDPNFRILWIASNSQLAEDWTASMEDQFENNAQIVARFLPPDRQFKPASRTGKSWSRKQFTIGTRTVSGIKSPTMQAVGREGRILSRDVDFMIVDDIDDDKSTIQPSARTATRHWFTVTAGSRVMDKTGVVVIGSRQHPDDLYGYLLDNVEWRILVERAHNPECGLPEMDEEVHIDCMMFPELNPYRWLQSQRRAFEISGGDALFQMVYQNVAIAEGLMIFNPDAMRATRTPRVIGEIPEYSTLVAGLDPSVAGYQSAFMWGFNRVTKQMALIDLVQDAGAGVPGFLTILREWFQKYPDLRHWVIEENGFQRGYATDTDVRNFVTSNGIHLEGHQTQKNKWDPHIGLTALAKNFEQFVTITDATTGREVKHPMIDLPYGNPESMRKTDLYISQAQYFSREAAGSNRNTRRGYKSDVLMASWFPMKAIRRWVKEYEAEVEFEYEQSYSSFSAIDWNEAPW